MGGIGKNSGNNASYYESFFGADYRVSTFIGITLSIC